MKNKIGSNWVVLVAAIVIGAVAFFASLMISRGQTPPKVDILVAARDLNVGDVVTQADLLSKTVFQDNSNDYYIPTNEAAALVGGYVTIPVMSGQPVMRLNVIADAGIGEQLSAILAHYGEGYRLFTLPMDEPNIVTASIEGFNPGDLIGLTLTVVTRPQAPTTPTPTTNPTLAVVTPTPQPIKSTFTEANSRIWPPMAKDLFPEGVRVVAVYGKPHVQAAATPDSNNLYQSSSTEQLPQYLVLLVPNEDVEMLSFALTAGEQLYVTLMVKGSDTQTAGFTFWDLEDWMKADRQDVLSGSAPDNAGTDDQGGGQ